MHTSTIVLTGLAAVSAYATPLNVRQASPSGFVTVTQSSHAVVPTGSSSWSNTSGYPSVSNTTYSTLPILGVATAKPNLPTPSGLVAELLTADSQVSRFKDIEVDIVDGTTSLVFDFNPAANPGVKAGYGGQVDLASRSTFPALTNQGIAAAGVFFQPCGLNTPHIHPRATEFLTLVTDSHLSTGFVLENGETAEFRTNLTQFQGTVFPMGSIHWQQNNDCHPAVSISGLNNEDPGASSIAQNFLMNTNPDIVDAALGVPSHIFAENFQQFKSQIPPPLVLGVESCLQRCGINY